jgi:hypothetical protein
MLSQDGSMSDNREEKEFPSLAEQGKNLAKFTFEVVKDVMLPTETTIYATDQLKQQRLDTCKTCEYYHQQQNRCRHCGCWLDHKVKFVVSSCPIDKW